MKRIYFLLFAFVFIASCNKDKPSPNPTAKGVYVVNEGLFNFGQAEVSFYNPATNEVSNDLFHAVNGYSLGDVGQSMFIKDSVGYIVVNNSAKVEVVKIPGMQSIRTIAIPGSSPRNFLPVNDSIAYVTELFAKKIWVVNYKTGALAGYVTTQGWTENMFKIGNDVFVQQKINALLSNTFATLLKVNVVANTEQHNNTFGGRDANGIVKDKLDRIWVAVDEDTALGLKAGFYCFDKDLAEQKSFFFTTGHHHPGNLCVDAAGENLYFSDKDVFTFSINDNAVPTGFLISGTGKNIYSMRMDPATDDIYMSDALDFVQQSIVYRYNKNGALLHSFTAGVIAGNFAFSNE